MSATNLEPPARAGNQAQPAFSVAVVIPLFNKEQAIRQTIRSVLEQTRPPDELIVIDDGSTDKSMAVAEEVLRTSTTDIPYRLIGQANAGVSVARNRGVAETSSQFIAFLDGDDQWASTHLAELQRLATQFPDAGVLSTHTVVIEHDKATPEPTPLSPEFFGLLERPLAAYRRGIGIIRSSSAAVRRDAFTRAGGFPAGAHAGEDIYLWLTLGMVEKFAHSGESLVFAHAQFSAEAQRYRMIGYEFSYFLGSEEGRKKLSNEDLARFMSSHLLAHIVWRRLKRHSHVQGELRRLARALPYPVRLQCALASRAPLWLLRLGKALAAASKPASERRTPRPVAGKDYQCLPRL